MLTPQLFPASTWLKAGVLALLAMTLTQRASAEEGVWRQRGFRDFAAGTFGNAGQNLYVSQAGVLQRIFQFDLNGDGFLDLVLCNSHGKWEQPPAYVYPEPLTSPTRRIEVPADGAVSGAVADLNGDGYDDLVIAMSDNGTRADLNSYIYFGSPEGYSEKRLLLLPTPGCLSTITGDFNGDGKVDVAFLLPGKLRIFYQNALGFESKRFKELAINGRDVAANDLLGRGITDLVLRTTNSDLEIYWGSTNGLTMEGSVQLKARADKTSLTPSKDTDFAAYSDYIQEAKPLAKVVRIGQIPYLFAPDSDGVRLVPVRSNHSLGEAIQLNCPQALSIAVGDVNGDGFQDLVLACRQKDSAGERSWVYWGSKTGFSESYRTPLITRRACDVALTDLDGDSCDEVVFCQYFTDESFSSDSLVYRGSRNGRFDAPIKLATEDAHRVLVVHTAGQRAGQLVFVNSTLGEKVGNPDVWIYWGGQQGFASERRLGVAGQGAIDSLSVDLNDDGLADLVVANCSEDSVSKDPGSYVFLNSANGIRHDPTLKLPTTRAHGVACADINRDGFLDLIFCGFDNPELLIFWGNAQGWNTKNPHRIPPGIRRCPLQGPALALFGRPERRWLARSRLADDH